LLRLAVAHHLPEPGIGVTLTLGLHETATEHLSRNSCFFVAAVVKAVEPGDELILRGPSVIDFIRRLV